MALVGVGCTLEPLEVTAPPACYQDSGEGAEVLCERLPGLCERPSADGPALAEAVTVVPDSAAMPEGVVSQTAHNNLDVIWHRGRLFFAFRTAPLHFASRDVVLYVVSTTDLQSWTLETSITMGKDLREPRFLSLGDRLVLYFARLGEITFTFEPEAMMLSERLGGCQWTAPEELWPAGADAAFIPWRARAVDGRGQLIGYTGGENIYDFDSAGIEVHWLSSDDGRQFQPVVSGRSAVLVGGSSETDWAMLADGSLVAVSRNEAGDDFGWGSKICTAQAGALGDWSCLADPKKYDSPLVFRHGAGVYLIGRRQVINDGLYDLGMDELTPSEQTLEYQTQYWGSPKRCSLWQVDPQTRSVSHLLDLPSNGDTCFASLVPLGSDQYLVFNYTSPLDDPELSWRDGQFGPTSIYRTTLTMP